MPHNLIFVIIKMMWLTTMKIIVSEIRNRVSKYKFIEYLRNWLLVIPIVFIYKFIYLMLFLVRVEKTPPSM